MEPRDGEGLLRRHRAVRRALRESDDRRGHETGPARSHGWLRKQPIPMRKHGNAERTWFNKISHIPIFLKALGRSELLKQSEYPQFEETLTAHSDEELQHLFYANAARTSASCLTSDEHRPARRRACARRVRESQWKRAPRAAQASFEPPAQEEPLSEDHDPAQWLADAIRPVGSPGSCFPIPRVNRTCGR